MTPGRRPLRLAVLPGLGLQLGALQACSSGSAPGTRQAAAGSPVVPAPAAPVALAEAAPLSETDRRFVAEAAASGLYRLEVARLAEWHSLNPLVKAYAALLAQQQATANEELQALVVRRRFIWPGGPPALRLAGLPALQALQGDAFDQRFVQQIGVADHQARGAARHQGPAAGEGADARADAGRLRHRFTVPGRCREWRAIVPRR